MTSIGGATHVDSPCLNLINDLIDTGNGAVAHNRTPITILNPFSIAALFRRLLLLLLSWLRVHNDHAVGHPASQITIHT